MYDHMSVGGGAPLAAQKAHKPVTSARTADRRAGLTRSATSVDLPRGHTSDADFRAFRTENRPIPIPDLGWRALERLACGNDGRSRWDGGRRQKVRPDHGNREFRAEP